jgi:hypothetical protein
MTKTLRVLVLLAVGHLAVIAGPIVDGPQLAPDSDSGAPPSYLAFMALQGPLWLLGPTAGTFDSTMHYAMDGLPPPAPAEPLADQVAIAPEPRAIALLSFGFVVLALLGIRRRRGAHSDNL